MTENYPPFLNHIHYEHRTDRRYEQVLIPQHQETRVADGSGQIATDTEVEIVNPEPEAE